MHKRGALKLKERKVGGEFHYWARVGVGRGVFIKSGDKAEEDSRK